MLKRKGLKWLAVELWLVQNSQPLKNISTSCIIMLIFLSPGKKPPLGQFTLLSSPLETHLRSVFVDRRWRPLGLQTLDNPKVQSGLTSTIPSSTWHAEWAYKFLNHTSHSFVKRAKPSETFSQRHTYRLWEDDYIHYSLNGVSENPISWSL